ncbi:MAG: hypothetical protein LUD81_10010, partial [Clostridiales bacterium]|nr:hypothetical protein [Clostridiales bacterium]
SLLINLNFVSFISKAAAPIAKNIFNISSEGFFVFLSGITSGYPIGIGTLSEMYKNKLISKPEALRLSAYCSNSGPLFILGSVGTVMLKSPSGGLIILICHYAAPIILGVLLGPYAPENKSAGFRAKPLNKTFGSALSHSVENGCRSMISVGGFIVLFSVITRITRLTGILRLISSPLSLLGIDKALTERLVLSILEMTNGCRLIAETNTPLKLPFLCFIISFGGLCVHAQSAALLEESSLPCLPYITGKIICGLISFFLCCIVLLILK